ncbi:MAG TPA: WecB/TagA/CpsF family glycosyltransferase [Acidobacteriaceae bacterium]|nr:WecB/TagA/CpsF family glycosyltransferase [Acidobacteriaceae bacterium]
MIDLGKKNVLGVAINALDYECAIERIMANAKAGKRCATTALAVHGLMTGVLEPAHRHRLNSFDLVTPDGQPVRWALNLLYGTKLPDRVYGPNLTLQVCQEAARKGLSVYFYGSKAEVVDKLCERMRVMCPGLKIAGAQPSEFRTLSAREQMATVEKIRSSGAHILFVGLGCPRQEVFTYEMSQHLNMPVLAVGAAFDYHAGLLQEPPRFLQDAGLQWLYRLCQDPGRLWRRYLFTNTQFLAMFLAQWVRVWRPSLDDTQVPLVDVRFG